MDDVSLNKYISSKGICSRREADRLIEAGRVLVNGKVARKGNRVSMEDDVVLDGQRISKPATKKKGKKLEKPQEHTYLLFNKPVGIITTTDLREPANIISYINYHKRIFPVGRLDKDSEGLLLLTDDGDIVNKILRARYDHEKEYIVTVNQPITNEFIEGMRAPMTILGQKIKKVKVKKLDKFSFNIILTQGLNRQIRRMVRKQGFKVKRLQRVRLMNLLMGELPAGKWRHVNQEEMRILRASIDRS